MDTLDIGPTPSEETCAQIGDDDYATKARAECRRFIALILAKFGHEPTGARLIIKANPHDFGTYYEVAVKYDENNANAIDYAFKVEADAPATWEG